MKHQHHPNLDYTHTRLLVDDFAACFRFYRDVIGLEVAWGDESEGYADLRTGETTLALFDRDAMVDAVGTETSARGQEAVALVFRVEKVDETYDQLRADGSFETEPHDRPEWGIRVAHLRDPDGTLLEINEPIEEA